MKLKIQQEYLKDKKHDKAIRGRSLVRLYHTSGAYIGAAYHFTNPVFPEAYLIKMDNENLKQLSDVWELE
jgi:hypothetical protein